MSNEMRKSGCCAVCNEPIWEALSEWQDGPLRGEMRKMGGPLPGAYRATVLLRSGNTCDISMCQGCELTPQNLPGVWRAIMERVGLELDDDCRKALKAQPLSPEQREWAEKMRSVQFIDRPLGVLSTQRLDELYG
jgi:hypothetical protein